MPDNTQSKWPIVLSLTFLAGLVVSYFIIPDFKSFINEAYNILTSNDKQRIEQFVNEIGAWGPILIILAMTAQMFMVVIPSFMLMLVAILAYGPYWGILIIVAAIFTASTIGFVIGKWLGPVTVQRIIGKKQEDKLEFYVERYGYWVIIITRLAPFLSNDAISFVAGLLKMQYWKFIGATMAGILPLSILLAIFSQDTETLKSALIWISIISTVLLVIYIIWDRTTRKGK